MTPAIDFRIVVEQYNRQLDQFRNTAQKIVAAIAGYTLLHAGSKAVSMTEKEYTTLFLIGHFILAAYVTAIGTAGFLRMASAHGALGERLGDDRDPELQRLGVLRHEPVLVAITWGSLYFIVHGGFLVIVHFVRWR